MIQVNFVAVAIAGVSAMVVGSLWYSKMLFARPWMKLNGLTEADAKSGNMALMYGGMFAGALVEAYILSMFIHYAGAATLMNGAKTGLWAWLGFVAPVMLGNYLFTRKPLKLYLIDSGYALVNLLIMGSIIASWY